MPGSRAALALVAASMAAVVPVSAAHAEVTAPEGAVAGAWYPSGIGVLTAPLRPAGSLHVGATVGQETDRTYLRFELPSLPRGAEVDRVTVSIPLDPDAGTSAPETAVVLACGVPEGFDPDAAEPAAVDCDGAPQADISGGVLSVDLEDPGGTVDVALVPGGGDTWHIAFDGPDGDAPPAAVASYEVGSPSSTTTQPRQVAPPPRPTPAPPPGPAVAPPSPTTTLSPSPGRIVAGEAELSAPSAVTPVPATGSTGFHYPAVFVLPLALLVVVGLVGDGLTRPVRLREEAP